MTFMRDASFVFSNAFLRAMFSSSGVFTKCPLPPNASMIFSYRAEGNKAVGGALYEGKYQHIFIYIFIHFFLKALQRNKYYQSSFTSLLWFCYNECFNENDAIFQHLRLHKGCSKGIATLTWFLIYLITLEIK